MQECVCIHPLVSDTNYANVIVLASPVSQPCHTCTPQGLSGSKGERGLPGAVQGTLGTGLQGPHYLRLGSPALPPEGDRPPAHQGLALQRVT